MSESETPEFDELVELIGYENVVDLFEMSKVAMLDVSDFAMSEGVDVASFDARVHEALLRARRDADQRAETVVGDRARAAIEEFDRQLDAEVRDRARQRAAGTWEPFEFPRLERDE